MTKFTQQEIEFMVNNVVGNFACSGMILTDEEIDVLYKIGRGELFADSYVKEIIKMGHC
ncbi:MAG: hypothetical protein IJ716_11860 [Lachnospiraceae bacterium]|nr:hypothetical protein [Lachnospiraceae bacterium]